MFEPIGTSPKYMEDYQWLIFQPWNWWQLPIRCWIQNWILLNPKRCLGSLCSCGHEVLVTMIFPARCWGFPNFKQNKHHKYPLFFPHHLQAFGHVFSIIFRHHRFSKQPGFEDRDLLENMKGGIKIYKTSTTPQAAERLAAERWWESWMTPPQMSSTVEMSQLFRRSKAGFRWRVFFLNG